MFYESLSHGVSGFNGIVVVVRQTFSFSCNVVDCCWWSEWGCAGGDLVGRTTVVGVWPRQKVCCRDGRLGIEFFSWPRIVNDDDDDEFIKLFDFHYGLVDFVCPPNWVLHP